VELAESSGLKNPDDYYPPITDEEVEQLKQAASQPQPDPALAIEQAKGQVQMALKDKDVEVALKTAEIGAQSDVVKNQAELEADLQTKEADRQNALIIEQQKANVELEKQARELAFRQWEVEFTANLKREEMANSANIAESNNAARAEMAKNKPKPNGKSA
jgi:hypothetical protein